MCACRKLCLIIKMDGNTRWDFYQYLVARYNDFAIILIILLSNVIVK